MKEGLYCIPDDNFVFINKYSTVQSPKRPILTGVNDRVKDKRLKTIKIWRFSKITKKVLKNNLR